MVRYRTAEDILRELGNRLALVESRQVKSHLTGRIIHLPGGNYVTIPKQLIEDTMILIASLEGRHPSDSKTDS